MSEKKQTIIQTVVIVSTIIISLIFLSILTYNSYKTGTPNPQNASSTTGNPTKDLSVAKDLVVTLAPFIAIATFIERFWETFFNWYESMALQLGRLIGVSADSVKWMKTEIANAEKVVENLVGNLGTQTPGKEEYNTALKNLEQAETRLLDAQSRLSELLKSPIYTSSKKAIILGGSLVIGLCISFNGHLMLFHNAGYQTIPPIADMLITGLLIGSGSGPLHSFIGTLQEFRNTMSGLADLASGTAVKKAAEALNDAKNAATQPIPQTIIVNPPAPVNPPVQPVQPAGQAVQPEAVQPTVTPATAPSIERNLGLQRQVDRMLRVRR